VSEVEKRSDDRELIERAGRENRILLTEDKDFGWLVFVSHPAILALSGRIYFRTAQMRRVRQLRM
jgi:predicted nuclease of predicted toxin-antitoxin system